MPYDRVPEFVQRIAELEAMAARALEFLILTAARTSEAIGAKWSEFDLEAGVWIVPAHPTKSGREHRVPLTRRAVQIVADLCETRVSDYVFPGQKANRPLSSMAMEMLMRRTGNGDYTVHGFRSAFRDWAGDETHFPREVAEAALAHSIGSAVELAYRRSDALAKRRKLMEAWSEYCWVSVTDKVVPLRG